MPATAEIRFDADDRAPTEFGTYILDREHIRGEGWFYTLLWLPKGHERALEAPRPLGTGRPGCTANQEGTLREMRRFAAWHHARLAARVAQDKEPPA